MSLPEIFYHVPFVKDVVSRAKTGKVNLLCFGISLSHGVKDFYENGVIPSGLSASVEKKCKEIKEKFLTESICNNIWCFVPDTNNVAKHYNYRIKMCTRNHLTDIVVSTEELNMIENGDERITYIRMCGFLLKFDGILWVQINEGDKKGIKIEEGNLRQNNLPVQKYIGDFCGLFKNVKLDKKKPFIRSFDHKII